MKRTAFLFLFNLIIVSSPSLTYCWIFPEHRDIARVAVERLSPEQRKLFEDIWKIAIKGSEGRLTPNLINNGDVSSHHLIDFVSWPAISGDHSISSKILLQPGMQPGSGVIHRRKRVRMTITTNTGFRQRHGKVCRL